MKNIMICLFLVFSIPFCVIAQKNTSPYEPLLNAYYDVKNALVKTDANLASDKAEALVKVINGLLDIRLSNAAEKDFTTQLKTMKNAASKIAESEIIERQRKDFIIVSEQITLMAKTMKLADQTIYQQYCPMKKASWLSSKKEIENPYYGDEMLDCGKITAKY